MNEQNICRSTSTPIVSYEKPTATEARWIPGPTDKELGPNTAKKPEVEWSKP